MSNQPKFKYILLISDAIVISACIIATLMLAVPEQLLLRTYLVPSVATVGLLVPVFLIIFLLNNLYKRQTLRSGYRHFIVIVKSVLIGIGTTVPVLIIASWGFFSTYGRDVILYLFAISVGVISSARLVLASYLLSSSAGMTSRQTKLLIVGGDEAAKRVANAIHMDTSKEFKVVGFVDDYKPKGQIIHGQRSNLGTLGDIGQLIRSIDFDEILIAIDRAPYTRLMHIVNSCLTTGKVVRIYSDRLSVICEKMNVELYSNIPVVMLSQSATGKLDLLFTRITNLVISTIALIVLAPIMLVVSTVIKLSSPGPIIYRQTRVGRDGRPFAFYKFRSMHVGTSEDGHKEFVEDFIRNSQSSNKEMEMTVFKVTDDPRIFPFGRFMRKTSIDELPQLLNVLKGDMSLVGPRPCLPYEWECYDDWHKERLDIVPGCTGLWQALGRSAVTFEEMVIMDLYYISNHSLHLDLRIILLTFPVIFLGKGGY